jgi:hypothetical protein
VAKVAELILFSEIFWQRLTACGSKMVFMRRLKASALIVFCLSILFYFFFDYCKHAPGLGISNPFASDPYDAVGSFGIQLALLAELLMLVRVFRPYPQEEAAPNQLLLALRAGTVTLLSVAVTLVADFIGLVRDVITNGVFPAAGVLAALAVGMTFLMLAVSWFFAHSARGLVAPSAPHPWGRAAVVAVLAVLLLALYPLAWREASIPGALFTAVTGMALLFVAVWALATAIFPSAEFAYEDIFDDLAAIYAWKREKLRFAKGLFAWLDKLAALPFLRKLLGWLSPRQHRWNLVLLAALGMGVSLVLVESFAEGLSPNLGRVLLVFAVYIGIEGAGVALGYGLLGRFLEIFRAEM